MVTPDEIPIKIADEERIVRAVIYPYHYDRHKRQLKKEAFRPKPETDLVSVMRSSYISATDCKNRAKTAASQNGEYVGFAKLISLQIHECGVGLVDAREDFPGHAHIVLKFPAPPRGEPLPPETSKQFNELLKCLRDKATMLPDPDVPNSEWTGGLLS